MEPIGDLFYWIEERENIRRRRKNGMEPPWTNDPIMQRYHFCNVHRQDDRGTKERYRVIHKHRLDYDDLPWAYTLSNLFNYAPSLDTALSGNGWPARLQARMMQEEKVFHTAYVVSTCGVPGSKIDYVAGVAKAVKARRIRDTSCQDAFDDLVAINGLGSFLAGQIVADLKYDRYLVGTKVKDFHSFSVMGPGSKKGLDLIYGGGTSPSNYQRRIRSVYEACMEYGGWIGNIHMQDFQNCLCEYAKMVKYREGEKGRRRYYRANA